MVAWEVGHSMDGVTTSPVGVGLLMTPAYNLLTRPPWLFSRVQGLVCP